MSNEFTLSVVIACYRDGGSVDECYNRLKTILPQVAMKYEIIFVNDASPDNAETNLNAIAQEDPRVVIINHTRNFGSQNAFLSGIRLSRGDAVILMDGDLQDPPSLIPALVEQWLDGYQVVYGIRVKRQESFFRQLAYKAFYRIYQRMAHFHVPLDAGDFGLMDRRVIEVLLGNFPEHFIFLRGLRAYTGFKHTGVKYVRERRFDGVSTNSLAANIRWFKMAIFSFSRKPLEYISFTAFFSVLMTFFALVFYFFAYVWKWMTGTYTAPPGYMTLLVIILFLGSVQLVGLAFIAEYIGHIFEEVKSRPRYIVRDVVDNRDIHNSHDGSTESGCTQSQKDEAHCSSEDLQPGLN